MQKHINGCNNYAVLTIIGTLKTCRGVKYGRIAKQ